jgi:hypothetical protein
MMRKRWLAGVTAIVFLLMAGGGVYAGDMELLGVKFPGEKVIEGKTLKLNGLGYLKKLGFVKVYVSGLYLEQPTQDANTVIESEQVKYLETHYLTSKATAKKISEGFVELIEEANPPELVKKNRAAIEKYAAWLDKDMKPGLTSASTYVPGKGLTLTYQGEVRGTIPGSEFMQMYYRYNVGEKANKTIREGLLGR